ncbi:unnamed protein product [Rodentolepis nana]|uniref:VPS13_mid_rpt domain-containing protein n=1 Tax=Rodentolepis nana TaxID=102285 RepID=A0A0R3T7X3_RODNA|nr:unnamed protein product [Rodentolepis nana]
MENSEPNTLAGLKRVFNKPDLDVNKFISKVSKNGGAEIIQTLTDLNRMTDEASAQMKRAIFNNFKLFIDASKAVTVLSTIMHQLDNQLVEQKRLCAALAEKSLFRDGRLPTSYVMYSLGKSNNENEKSSKLSDDISSLLSSVDGVSNLVKDSSRQLLFDADAIEVNPITYSKLGYFHLFVLSDFILVAKKQHDSYEMHRYRKQALYEIENVVVVDVKSTDSQKVAPLNLVQLLVFPDSRVFQMESTKVKRALISTIDEVKRLHLTVIPADELEVEADANPVVESGGALNSDGLDSNSNRSASLVSVDATPEVETMCFEALAGTIPEIAHFIRREKPSTASITTTRVNRKLIIVVSACYWV